MSFPLVYLLIPFGLVLLLAILFFFFNVFHLKRYAIRSGATTTLALMYVLSFGVILLGTAIYLSTVDWSQEITANDILPGLANFNVLDRSL